VIPVGIVGPIRDTGVETRLRQNPASALADCPAELNDIVVRVTTAEGEPCGVVEILAVREDDGPLDSGLERQSEPLNK
jgi:hypothetical protein